MSKATHSQQRVMLRDAEVSSDLPKPFLKWAGGKSQLLAEIRSIWPDGLGTTITKYAEPFVGGGAVLFDILGCCALEAAYISDTNAELINAYRVLQGDVESLVERLRSMQSDYLPLPADLRKQYYYDRRARFNQLKPAQKESASVEKAALLIFLNKTCFNGLFRVNRRGLFNVPMGTYQTPRLYSEDNLRRISRVLQQVEIVCGDYHRSACFIDGKTFAYFDPPYRPLSTTAGFTAYTEKLFDDRAQRELAGFVAEMDRRGAKVLVSNSDPFNADTGDAFFDDLYEPHRIRRVRAARNINCNIRSRGKISELLITNY